MRNTEIERPANDRAAPVERTVVTEVVPQAERQSGQVEAAASAPSVVHAVVAIRGGNVGHAYESRGL